MDQSVMVAATGFVFTGKSGRSYTVRRGMTVRADHPDFKDKQHLLKPQRIDFDHEADQQAAKERVAERPKVDDVLAEVGDDATKARQALAKENASGEPRKTLVEKLERIANPAPDSEEG